MRLDLTDMLYALSFALDSVEAELVGVNTGHGKRVAYLSLLMGKEAGYREEELRDFIGCCLLHDNALTESINDELSDKSAENLSPDLLELCDMNKLERNHSVIGEDNIRLLPFRSDVKNVILYHHENADGSGVFGKKASETPLKSQILHFADIADTAKVFRPESMTKAEYDGLCEWVNGRKDIKFSGEVAELFKKAVSFDKIAEIQEKGLEVCLHEELHKEIIDYPDETIRNIANLFTKIVDYKSEFTERHSTGVAQKAEIMARYYGFDAEKSIRFYFAGAMHDIGKLAVSNNILEKPDKLTDEEFSAMKNHASATYYVLKQIKEIPDILEWASNHHEKLNGKGYPRGLSAEQLSFEDQLMACVDIYQALTEKRPYKDGMSHEKSISIMLGMAERNELNEKIVRDMDALFAKG